MWCNILLKEVKLNKVSKDSLQRSGNACWLKTQFVHRIWFTLVSFGDLGYQTCWIFAFSYDNVICQPFLAEEKKIPSNNVESDERNTAGLRNIGFQHYSDTADRPTGSSSPKLQIRPPKFTNSQIPYLNWIANRFTAIAEWQPRINNTPYVTKYAL